MLSQSKQWSVQWDEWCLSAVASIAVIIVCTLSFRWGLSLYHGDALANLNSARFAVVGFQTGLSQIGSYNPLLRILLLPFISFLPLYRTGIAGWMVMMPSAVVATLFFYKTLKLLTENIFFSCIAAFLFLLNPYFLYFSTTPMTEVVYLAMLSLVAYFFLVFLLSSQGKYLLFTALFVSFASLARMEGMALYPIILFILFLRAASNSSSKKKWPQIVWFVAIAGLGAAFLFLYGWKFMGDPFAFSLRSLRGFSISERFATLHQSWWQSFQIFLHASYLMQGASLTLFSLLSVIILPFVLLFTQHRISRFAVLMIFLSPALATILVSKTGLRVMNAPPFGILDNERYAFPWLGFVILSPILVFQYFWEMDGKVFLLKRGVMRFCCLVLILALTVDVLWYSEDTVLREHWLYSHLSPQYSIDPANALSLSYDFGKVLISHGANPATVYFANEPLDVYIYEMSHPYFEQTLVHPWLYARWIINSHEIYAYSALVDPVEKTKEFSSFYEQVAGGEKWKLFKIRDAEVREFLIASGCDPDKAPSMNPSIVRWDPATIEKEICPNGLP